MTEQKACRGQSGFTLLEVLVAISLIAIALLVIVQLFSANLRGMRTAEDYARAVIRAEGEMRDVLDRKDLAEGEWSEMRENRYRVDVAVKEALPKRTETIPYQLYLVTLNLRWAEGTRTRTVTLSTLKLVERKI
ncbi:MAG: prepilin-type N-terminal cleavage/methylation domain-containing protein [Thermodesulfovibrionales bacterium]|jgi:general secretion pathway protein I